MRFFIAMLAGVLALMAGVVADQVWLMAVGGVVWLLAMVLWVAAPAGGREASRSNRAYETITGEWDAEAGGHLSSLDAQPGPGHHGGGF